MPEQRVDYDRIARRYDDEESRDRPADEALIDLCAQRGSVDGDGVAALDIGCGTGIRMVKNRVKLPRMRAVGLDLHQGMLEVARKKADDIEWVQGDAARMPFGDVEFDYVSAELCFHHMRDKLGALVEVARVLRPGGRFFMRNMSPWRMLDWEVYRYFPEALARDEVDFWQESRIREALLAVGLVPHDFGSTDYRGEADLGQLLAFYRERYSPSQLVALSDDHFRAGLERIERELTLAAGATVKVPTHFCLITIGAEKPG
jgi:ubiquinone/menaquinone biosynthesis C-methylase UbiE